MADFVQNLLQLHQLIGKIGVLQDDIERAAEQLSKCINAGGIVYVIGNGGSSTDADHFVAELLGRFKKERKAMPALSLTNSIATLTAISNDYSYDTIFVRQLEGLFNKDKDILITITTSGNSKNILYALDYVDDIGGKAINLLGKDGGIINKIDSSNEINIIIPSYDTARIQEMHIHILHYFAEYMEDNLR